MNIVSSESQEEQNNVISGDDVAAEFIKALEMQSEEVSNDTQNSTLNSEISSAYINYQVIDTSKYTLLLHNNGVINATQYIDYSIENPFGDTTGVKYFGAGPDGNNPFLIYLDNANVEPNSSFIFSFYVFLLRFENITQFQLFFLSFQYCTSVQVAISPCPCMTIL